MTASDPLRPFRRAANSGEAADDSIDSLPDTMRSPLSIKDSSMSQARMKDWLETLGIIAVVASLVFVGLQMKQDRKIAVADSYAGVVDSTLHVAELIADRSELWRRGLDGGELSVEEQIQFNVLADAVEQTFANGWQRATELGIGDPEIDVRDYAIALHSHPGLLAYFESVQARYETTDAAYNLPPDYGHFGGLVRETLAYLEDNSVPVLEPKAYVFWD